MGGSRTYHLTRRYGLTAAEVDLMLQEQSGACAICREAPAVHVDHDHMTGQVRALLCFNCNGGLGQFRDDPQVLRRAADYVDLHTNGADGPPRLSRRHGSVVDVSARIRAMQEADARRATAPLPAWLLPAAAR